MQFGLHDTFFAHNFLLAKWNNQRWIKEGRPQIWADLSASKTKRHMSNVDYWPPQAVPAHTVAQIKKEGCYLQPSTTPKFSSSRQWPSVDLSQSFRYLKSTFFFFTFISRSMLFATFHENFFIHFASNVWA